MNNYVARMLNGLTFNAIEIELLDEVDIESVLDEFVASLFK